MVQFPIVYSTENGRSDVLDFLSGLSIDGQARSRALLQALASGQLELGRPHVAFLREGIWELRVRSGTTQYRYLFGLLGSHRYLILKAWQKDRSAVPPETIREAARRLAGWKRRYSI